VCVCVCVYVCMYSRTPLIWFNREGEPNIYAEIQINGFFFENGLHWQFDVRLLLFTVSKSLHLNLWTTPDLKFWKP
jgi:hypothetical protein